MLLPITPALKEALRARGVESFHGPAARLSSVTQFEPPCGIKWMQIENHLSIGAFSYGVSGYYSEVDIGRYVSIGEQVQIGRSSHPLTWVSTSPFLYLRTKVFDIGTEFDQSDEYHSYIPPAHPGATSTEFKRTVIGNDVYIGHGAMIMPGVRVGDGAVVGAMSVVTKDVPAYGVVGGNPATLIKMRFSAPIAARLLSSEWWRFAPWQLAQVDCSSAERAGDELNALAIREVPYLPGTFHLNDLVPSKSP